jgi:hypothetical protein
MKYRLREVQGKGRRCLLHSLQTLYSRQYEELTPGPFVNVGLADPKLHHGCYRDPMLWGLILPGWAPDSVTGYL